MVELLLRKPASSLGHKVCDMSRSSCPGSGSQVFINVWANINGYAIMTTRVGVWHNSASMGEFGMEEIKYAYIYMLRIT